MSKNALEAEVILARDARVGPKGGTRKAGTTVTVPTTEARLLVMEGAARYTKSGAPTATVGTDSTATNTGSEK